MPIARRVFGDEDEYMLHAMGLLAVVHGVMKDHAAVLPLGLELLAVRRRVQ